MLEYDVLVSELFSKEDSVGKLIEYLKTMNDVVEAKGPFIGGYSDFDYNRYLQDTFWNDEKMEPLECFEYIKKLMHGIPCWNNPGTMINIIPSANLVSSACADYVGILNPNFAQDTYAGHIIAAELEVSKYISELIGWNWKRSAGIFTFGGKGTNLYATKMSLGKADPEYSKLGGFEKKYFMLTSKNAHPCHIQACDWIGIGTNNCLEIPCTEDGKIELGAMERLIREYLQKEYIFLGINLNGGSTNELFIDPVKDVHFIIDKLKDEFKLQYKPHIHVDSVIGWAFEVFKEYDFKKNRFNFDKHTISKLKELVSFVDEFCWADSIGIDFHKMGFCEYSSSLFLVKNKDDFQCLTNKKIKIDNMTYGEYNPYDFTLELSRSSRGAVAALSSLKSMGKTGYQLLLGKWLENVLYFRQELEKQKGFVVHDVDSNGFATMFSILPENMIEGFNVQEVSLDDINNIRGLNNRFSAFLLYKIKNNEIDFYFPASRSYKIPGTDIVIGALKVYPTSVYLTREKIAQIVNTIVSLREEFFGFNGVGNSISDGMVYER